jgi:hypothetical protein
MPFCPKCRFEYCEGIYICPDCNEKLVPTLPSEDRTDADGKEYKDWMTLSKLETFQDAEMIRERLEELMIPVIVLSKTGRYDRARMSGMPVPSAIGSGYAILVPKEYAEQADLEGEAILGENWIKGKV